MIISNQIEPQPIPVFPQLIFRKASARSACTAPRFFKTIPYRGTAQAPALPRNDLHDRLYGL
jgi:hypothetical protein